MFINEIYPTRFGRNMEVVYISDCFFRRSYNRVGMYMHVNGVVVADAH